MASLKEVKEFFESGPMGRALPLAEFKLLSEEERKELCAELDKISASDR